MHRAILHFLYFMAVVSAINASDKCLSDSDVAVVYLGDVISVEVQFNGTVYDNFNNVDNSCLKLKTDQDSYIFYANKSGDSDSSAEFNDKSAMITNRAQDFYIRSGGTAQSIAEIIDENGNCKESVEIPALTFISNSRSCYGLSYENGNEASFVYHRGILIGHFNEFTKSASSIAEFNVEKTQTSATYPYFIYAKDSKGVARAKIESDAIYVDETVKTDLAAYVENSSGEWALCVSAGCVIKGKNVPEEDSATIVAENFLGNDVFVFGPYGSQELKKFNFKFAITGKNPQPWDDGIGKTFICPGKNPTYFDGKDFSQPLENSSLEQKLDAKLLYCDKKKQMVAFELKGKKYFIPQAVQTTTEDKESEL